VIHRYIHVPQLDNLIKYLEALIESPPVQQSSGVASLADYNKDYTALLLNCYVKKQKYGQMTALINRATDKKNKPAATIFDVDTAIEVCRQQEKTLEQAIQLAQENQKYRLLVQIFIENKKDYTRALMTIDQQIFNLKEKVDCLQAYGPKLIKESSKSRDKTTVIFTQNSHADIILDLAKDIVRALMDYTTNHG